VDSDDFVRNRRHAPLVTRPAFHCRPLQIVELGSADRKTLWIILVLRDGTSALGPSALQTPWRLGRTRCRNRPSKDRRRLSQSRNSVDHPVAPYWWRHQRSTRRKRCRCDRKEHRPFPSCYHIGNCRRAQCRRVIGPFRFLSLAIAAPSMARKSVAPKRSSKASSSGSSLPPDVCAPSGGHTVASCRVGPSAMGI